MYIGHAGMITFEYNQKKTTQAAAILINKAGDTLNYTKLIKLLYLADRLALERWERPISGDSYVSMNKGPVLSRTYELIGYPDESFWHRHIETDGYDVKLVCTPDDDELNNAEIELLNEIHENYKDKDYGEMINICHRICTEWEDPGEGMSHISVNSILMKTGKTKEEIKDLQEEIDSLEHFRELLKK